MKLILVIFVLLKIICSETYYEILELQTNATDYQIKKAFRRLSMKYHPDKSRTTDSYEKYQKINKAYEVLKDRTLRRIYDSQGEQGVKSHQESRQTGTAKDGFDFYSTRKNIERRGPQLRIKLQVTLEDIYNGNEINLYVTKQAICHHCKGTGANSPNDVRKCTSCNGEGYSIRRQQIAPGYYQQFQHQCERCGGKGVIVTSQCPICRGQKSVDGHDELSIVIDKGIESGSIITIEGAGDEYIDTSASDLLFEIVEIPHPKFTRRGYDLYYTIELTLKEALLGFKKKIQHLDDHYVKIERNQITSPGYIQRIVKEGMPIRYQKGLFGDLYVEYNVRFDHYYTEEQMNLLKQYFEEENRKNNQN